MYVILTLMTLHNIKIYFPKTTANILIKVIIKFKIVENGERGLQSIQTHFPYVF